MRLVIGLGPNTSLRRGFAIARKPDGRPIISRADAAHASGFSVHFHDGSVRVTNDEFQGGDGS